MKQRICDGIKWSHYGIVTSRRSWRWFFRRHWFVSCHRCGQSFGEYKTSADAYSRRDDIYKAKVTRKCVGGPANGLETREESPRLIYPVLQKKLLTSHWYTEAIDCRMPNPAYKRAVYAINEDDGQYYFQGIEEFK